ECVVGVVNTIEDCLEGTGIPFRFSPRIDRYHLTVPEVLATIEQLRTALGHAEEEIRDSEKVPTKSSERSQALAKARKAMPKARNDVSDLRAGELKRIGSNYAELLQQFYMSPAVLDLVTKSGGSDFTKKFERHVQDQARNRQLSTVDRYLLLWLIHLV